MKVYRQSIAKEAKIPSEDRILVKQDPPGYLIGLADGAGGEGIFAGQWAQWLLKHLPSEPIPDFAAFQGWMKGLWRPFYEQYQPMAARLSAQHLEQFHGEGSASTLVAAWLKASGHLDYIAYGDSVILSYDLAEDRLSVNADEIATYIDPPFLLNWLHDSTQKGFRQGQIKLQANRHLLVASDAIGHYLLARYLSMKRNDERIETLWQKYYRKNIRFSNLLASMAVASRYFSNFRQVIEELLRTVKEHDSNKFVQYTQQLRDNGFLYLDDYSLIYVET